MSCRTNHITSSNQSLISIDELLQMQVKITMMKLLWRYRWQNPT